MAVDSDPLKGPKPKLFAPEPEEEDHPRKPASSKASRDAAKPFGPEPEECESDSSSSSERLSAPTVFNFGWHAIHSSAKARFARDAASLGKQQPKKRSYAPLKFI